MRGVAVSSLGRSSLLTDISQMTRDWTVKSALLGRFGALRHRHLCS